ARGITASLSCSASLSVSPRESGGRPPPRPTPGWSGRPWLWRGVRAAGGYRPPSGSPRPRRTRAGWASETGRTTAAADTARRAADDAPVRRDDRVGGTVGPGKGGGREKKDDRDDSDHGGAPV